jgi:hypothetical protein
LADVLETLPWGAIWEQKNQQETLADQWQRLCTWAQALENQLALLEREKQWQLSGERFELWMRYREGPEAWEEFLERNAEQCERHLEDLRAKLQYMCTEMEMSDVRQVDVKEMTGGSVHADARVGLVEREYTLVGVGLDELLTPAEPPPPPPRPKGLEALTACPECGEPVADEWNACPFCRAVLKPVCPNCGRAIELGWVTCPYCGATVGKSGLIEEKIRMDVHTPETVKVDIPFEIGVAIRQPDSPAPEEAGLPVLTSKPGRVFREREQTEVKYRVRITAPTQDLEVDTRERVFLLRPDADSEVHYFQLTAKRAGHLSLVVEAYQEDELLAVDTRVHLIATLKAVDVTDAGGAGGPRSPGLSYRNLDLEAFDYLANVDEERFRVRVIDSPAGQQRSSDAEEVCLKASVRRRLLRLETRRTDLTMMMDLGEVLAGLLFPPRARRLLKNSLDLLKGNESLRIRLRLDTYALADLPWEYIYISAADTPREHRGPAGFLALDRRVSLVRYEVIGQRLIGLDPVGSPSLRLVALLANPREDLDLGIEQACIEEALKATPRVQPTFYPGATVSTLLDSLVKGAHVFHFAGHGSFEGGMGDRFGTKEGTGCIELEGEDPEQRKFDAGKLAQNLRGRGVRLAVFTACEVGRADPRNAWSGVAPALTRAGIPAVLAMQYRIYDANATAFSRQFYRTLAAGETIDAAVFEGRLAIFNRSGNNERDWGVPVLYLRAEEGVLFPP